MPINSSFLQHSFYFLQFFVIFDNFLAVYFILFYFYKILFDNHFNNFLSFLLSETGNLNKYCTVFVNISLKINHFS